MTQIVSAFFYGLYMDTDLLKSLGFHPVAAHKAVLRSYALDLFGPAKIVPRTGGIVWGNIVTLPGKDLIAMYSFEATRAYAPETVEVTDGDGNPISVCCYNLPKSDRDPFNHEYYEKLILTLKKLDFPSEYIVSLKPTERPS